MAVVRASLLVCRVPTPRRAMLFATAVRK